jgi:pimeloyl-ACP methyl ester carboxylesterase
VIRKILQYLAIGVACLAVAGLSFALLYRKYLQHEVVIERAIRSSEGISSLGPVRIGGIDQWIQVRGQNVNNPILLVIHGGPGFAFIPTAGAFQGPWENHFTVVEWDQRGAGKTYASNDTELQRSTMNVPQMEHDALEVVNYLRNRFHREKIFVLGHSWGSVLGVWLVHEHPELIYAYVGVGQIVNVKQNDTIARQDALEAARIRHNEQAVRDLENFTEGADRRAQYWEAQLLGPPASVPEFLDVRRLLSALVSAPEYSLADDYGFLRGQRSSLEIMIPEVTKVDVYQLGLDFRAPIFFFEGRFDPYSRPSLIWEYSQKIKAPQKEFVRFENSGHFPFFEEQQRFADELFQRVLPLAADHQEATR